MGRILDDSSNVDSDDILAVANEQENQQSDESSSEEVDRSHSSSSDILGSLADLGLRFFVVLVVSMLDCIEQTFANMSYASGKNLKWVLLIVATYLPVSVFSPLLGYSTCITWQDSIIAIVVMFSICLINGASKAIVNGAVAKIKEVSNKVTGGK